MIPVPPWRLPAPSLDAQRRLQGDSSIPHTPPSRQRHQGTGTFVLTVAMTFPVLVRFSTCSAALQGGTSLISTMPG